MNDEDEKVEINLEDNVKKFLDKYIQERQLALSLEME
jgi:hypothetical protein